MRTMRPAVAACCLVTTALAQSPPQPSPELAEVAAAYAAKVAASALFVSGRTLESVRAEELAPTRPLEALIAPLLRFDVDPETATVTCTLGRAKATAVRTAGCGCALLPAGADVAALRRRGATDDRVQPTAAAIDWPRGDRMPDARPNGIDLAAVGRAVDAAFAEPHPDKRVHTRAVVVLHRGRLVAERYADGYDAAMPLPGWSMTKTLTNALLGRRVAEGKFALDAPPAVPEWHTPADDPRAAIGVRDLLTMTAGLAWNESYDDQDSDALRMLFRSADHAAVYVARPVDAPPGARYRYASGSTNLLCKLLRATFQSDDAYWRYPRQLFDALGMRTAVLETDPSGTFVGSSYGFASARDWARLGLLYAQDGVFAGERVLPAGWVHASATPHPASNGRFGLHVWLNADPDGDGPAERMWPDLPADLLHMDGHEGQYCVISPSAELVVVRLGCTKSGGFGLRALLRDLHAALPAPSASATGR